MKVKCAVCSRERDRRKCTVYEVTEEERVALQRMGEENPPREYAYCSPCFRIMQNPALMKNLLKGVIEQRLRAGGVADAEGRATKFVEALSAKMQCPGTPSKT